MPMLSVCVCVCVYSKYTEQGCWMRLRGKKAEITHKGTIQHLDGVQLLLQFSVS